MLRSAATLGYIALVVCLLAPRGCSSTSIQPDSRSNPDNRNSLSTPEALGLLSEEHSAIFSAHQALLSFKSKPDCFQDAVAAFELQCGDRLSVDQDQKAETAVRLTGCDLSTGNQQLPSECQRLTATPSQQALSRCIEALSRSPQQWSTYSGYMRELPSLCFALRREKDVNNAQKLYQNMTKEKQALLKALQRMHASSELDRERAAAAMEDQLANFDDVITRLRETADSARQASDLASARYGDSVSSLVADVHSGAQEATRAVMDVLSQQLPVWLTSTMATELTRVTESHSQELGVLAQGKLHALIHQLQQGVEQQLRRHESHITELSTSLFASQSLVNEVVVGLNAVHAATIASVQELDAHRKALSDISAFNVDRLNHLDALLSRVEGVAQQELVRWDRQERRRQQRERRGLFTRIITSALGLDDEEALQVFSLTNAMVKATPFAKALLYSSVPGPLHVLIATTFAVIKLGWSVVSLLFTLWLLLFALSTRMLRPLTSRLAQWLERSVRGALLRERRPGNIEDGQSRYDNEDEGEVEAMLEVEPLHIKASRSPTPAACLDHAAPVNSTTFVPPSSVHNMTAVSGDRTRRSMSAF